MLKKLVQYGNSRALILDRAILELLDVGVDTAFKLKIDGKSLVITPQEPEVVANRFVGPGIEMCQSYMDDLNSKLEKMAADPKASHQEWLPGGEASREFAEAVKPIAKKYRDDHVALANPEYIKKVNELAAKFPGDKEGFVKELSALRLRYAPNLANYDKEIVELAKSMGAPNAAHDVNVSTKKKKKG